MELRVFQKGFNFSQDGPGNRLVYHLQGCNMHCPWCSNPEGMEMAGGKRCTVEQMAQEAMRSRMMFFEGGGVTLTGGEVGMQLDAAKQLLAMLHAQGIDTAIETNGTTPRLPELFPVLDHLMIDCKHHDDAIHTRVTGVSCRTVWENLRRAADREMDVAVRIPVIGGFNASASDAHAFAALFKKLQVADKITVELLPYHEYGREKYAKLGLAYRMTEQARVSGRLIEEMTEILADSGLKIIRT